MEVAKRKHARILSLLNVFGSTMMRVSDDFLLVNAGAERAVASTKAILERRGTWEQGPREQGSAGEDARTTAGEDTGVTRGPREQGSRVARRHAIGGRDEGRQGGKGKMWLCLCCQSGTYLRLSDREKQGRGPVCAEVEVRS